MKINHNIAAIKSHTKLSRTNEALQDSIERLSSGYRINKAADDAAGMAISQKMRTQIRGLEQASRNAADGVSVIETAEGALNEVEDMLQRMRELSVQAANETNTAEDREQIQSEIDQLSAEIDRISEDTEFNTKKLLNGDADRQFYANSSNVKFKSVSEDVKSGKYNLEVTQVGTKATTSGTGVGAGAVPASGKVTLNGESVVIEAGASLQSAFEAIRDLGEYVDVEVTTDTTLVAGSELTFTSLYEGSSQKVELSCDNEELADFLGISSSTVTEYGTDAELTLDADDFDTATTTVSADGNKVTILGKDGFEMKMNVSAAEEVDTFIFISNPSFPRMDLR